MYLISKQTKFWIFLSLLSLLIWTLYWTIPSSLERIVDLISGKPIPGESFGGVMYVWMEVSGAIGTTVRSIGVFMGIIALYLLSFRNMDFIGIKKLVAGGLLIEAFYYFMVGFPSGVFMTTEGYGGAFMTLGISYFLQFLFTVPLLVILAIKVYRHDLNKRGLIKWAVFAFVGYIGALWVNSVFRWFDMISTDGLSVFFTGSRAVGSINAFTFMSLAIIFSIIGVYFLFKRKRNPRFWIGLSLVMIGLHYLVYLIYTYYYGGMISSVMLQEVWAIPLLGLGASILRKK